MSVDPVVRQHAESFVDMLRLRSQATPHRIAYSFLQDRGHQDSELSYLQLYEQAAGLAVLLQQNGMSNERVLLAIKSNPAFIVAFFACLMAGAIAVPISAARREHLEQRLGALTDNAGARAGISDTDAVLQTGSASGKKAVRWFDIRVESRPGQLAAMAPLWKAPVLTRDKLAFLQYTSGTTGDPKGVMITHGNLMTNSAIIYEAFGHSVDSVGLIGLPLFHDMGLIGGVLQPMYGGFPVTLMTPAQLVQKPDRWLRLISELGVTTSGGPNFLYDLAIRQVKDEQLESVSLARWRVAFCGAEPVRSTTMATFIDRFAKHGFASEAFYPCYGMAETTLFITGNLLGQAPVVDVKNDLRSGQTAVSCGRPRGDTHVLIVEPKSRLPAAPGQEGEIWVSGASNAKGYWRRPKLSRATFAARLASDDGNGDERRAYLRTGDLGYLHNGELFVTGRLKDLIIVRGRNFAPQDLEVEAQQAHAGLREGCSAAFTVQQEHQERLVLACEISRELARQTERCPDVASAVRAAIANSYQLRVDDVVLMQSGTLPKTSSGKVKRSQCRLDYLAGTLLSAKERQSAIDEQEKRL